jgi:hypothetical protein
VILADTSVWVSYFRDGTRPDDEQLDRLIEAGEVVICGPVLAELIAGAGGKARETITETLAGLPWAELDHSGWLAVGMLAARLRQAGEKLPLTDLVIAVSAAGAGHRLWSLDGDFLRIAAVFEELDLFRPTES